MSESTESQNPRNFQIDYEAFGDEWRARFGTLDRSRVRRAPLSNAQAVDLLPQLVKKPAQGEPNWIHPGIKSWNESAFNVSGLTFLGCGLAGALRGSVKGYQQTRAHKAKLPTKLVVNSMLNWATRYGIMGSNTGAAVAVTSYAVAYLSETLRRKADAYNFIPAWMAIGGIAGGQRLGNIDLGLKGVVTGVFCGLLLGVVSAGVQQYRVEADVLPELQSVLGTKMFRRQDTRFIEDDLPPPSSEIYEILDETEQVID